MFQEDEAGHRTSGDVMSGSLKRADTEEVVNYSTVDTIHILHGNARFDPFLVDAR